MPSGNLSAAVVSPSSTVLPKGLQTAFVETNLYPILAVEYHDNTLERSLIQDGVNAPRSLRTWKLARRLSTADLTTLRTFWETTVQGGLNALFFYDPYEPLSGHPIGSNYDATGVSTQGRVTVVFRGNWKEVTNLGRSDVPDLMLEEIA